MSTIINDHMRDTITEIYKKENIFGKLFMFEHIPPKRLNNATKSYGSAIGSDEAVVFLFDDTFFGSGKDGFILTTKRIYFKDFMEKSNFVDIANITELIFNNVKLKPKIIIKTDTKELEISIASAPDKEALFSIMDQTVRFLKSLTDQRADTDQH